MSGYHFVELDTGSVLRVTCKDDASGDVIDLTGSTIKLFFSVNGGSSTERTMTVTAPTTGVAEYEFSDAELSDGQLVGEVEITDSGGKVITSLEVLTFVVRQRLP